MLTTATIKAARPAARPYKLFDGGGLHLVVRPTGSKTFRWKYRRAGREQLLTLGSWPEIDLGGARDRRDRARERLAAGIDLNVNMAAGHEDHSFAELARRWHAEQAPRWSPAHAADVLASLERDVIPAIGAVDPAAITARQVRDLLLAVERRGRIESARRLRERISAIFRLGIHDELCASDPAALVGDRLSPRPVARPQPALLELDQARSLLTAVDELVDCSRIAQLAHRFLALTGVRLAALRGAGWGEIEQLDGPEPRWRIPPGRMKLTQVRKADPAAEHVVPLSRQAVAVLRERLDSNGAARLIFPGRDPARPIGEGAIGALIARTEFIGRHVPHGWRASFSTLLNERWPEDRGLIDQALAHAAGRSKVEAAYNRARHSARMRDLFQRWADLVAPDEFDGHRAG